LRGYFGIGVEGISKAMNVGSIFRSAHAFGAGFVFTAAAAYSLAEGGKADTSGATGHVPFYSFPDVASLILPQGCRLVGVELLDDAAELPSFRHPPQAAYVLGPERGQVSPEMLERCDLTVKIPMRFSVNVGIAAALVMYDRIMSLGRYPVRPVRPGGKPEPLPEPRFGDPVFSKKAQAFETAPPLIEADEADDAGGDG